MPESPLDRARRKAYLRLLPLCFISYVIACLNARARELAPDFVVVPAQD